MPPRHCVFVCDLDEMEKAFKFPLSSYVEEFLERPTPGDRLRGFAELAFANAQQIQTLRHQDRETMVMARRLMATGQGPHGELAGHLKDLTGDYCRTRTGSQFKWFLHAFAASGRMWIREFVCSAGREWVEEALNLLLIQRGFSSTPEEAEEYRMTRETLLRLGGPFPVKEAGREVSDTTEVTVDAFPWCPLPDGSTHFRLVSSLYVTSVARTLTTLDTSPQAFQAADRPTPERLQEMARDQVNRLRGFLQLPFLRPAVLAFIGS